MNPVPPPSIIVDGSYYKITINPATLDEAGYLMIRFGNQKNMSNQNVFAPYLGLYHFKTLDENLNPTSTPAHFTANKVEVVWESGATKLTIDFFGM